MTLKEMNMPLRSKEWFYKQCLAEVEEFSRLSHMCWSVLKKGIGQEDQTRGHVTQAIGALQGFLGQFPNHKETIRDSDPTKPFDIGNNDEILHDWQVWFASQRRTTYGPAGFAYNYDTVRGYLTPLLGGRRKGGGGGNDEFKRVLRLMAEFLD
jgi:hypothetical protein